MSAQIGLGTAIDTSADFNRRAAVALKGVTFRPASWAKRFARDMTERIEKHWPLSEKQQQWLYNLVHQHRAQISDKLVLDYAASRAQGADS